MYRECIKGHVFKIPKALKQYLEKGYTTVVICPFCNSNNTNPIDKTEYEKTKKRGYSWR